MTQHQLFPLPPGAPSPQRARLARSIEAINAAVAQTDSCWDPITLTLSRCQFEQLAVLALEGAIAHKDAP